MELLNGEEEKMWEPVSPSGQYLNSSVMSLTILAVLELEVPFSIDDSQIISLVKHVFLPINPRFSCLMVRGKNEAMNWKQVEVKLEDHVKFPNFTKGKSNEHYDKCFDEYLSRLGMDELSQSRPLWEIHIFKYPTSNAASNLIFKLHHSLGDGYSLMGALLSCLQRADNPSLPLTFPSRQTKIKQHGQNISVFKSGVRVLSSVVNTAKSFTRSLLMSTFVEDDLTPIRSDDGAVEFRPMTITTMELSFDQLKEIKTNLKVTINDVIMGIVCLGTRMYMEEVDHDSRQSNSTTLVLLNTRNLEGYKSINDMVKPKSKMPWGNHFTFLHVPIPNISHGDGDSSNPINFVLQTHQMVKQQRNSSAVYLTGWLLQTLRKLRGPEATAQYIHSTLKNSSMTITNMIGPMEKMALANHPIKGLYFSVAGAPQSLSVTVMSYVGKIRISLGTEKGFIDPHKLKSFIHKAFHLTFTASTT